MKTRQFWYPLPERLIAQHPAERRGTERMMVLHRDTGVLEHRHVADIVEYLNADEFGMMWWDGGTKFDPDMFGFASRFTRLIR